MNDDLFANEPLDEVHNDEIENDVTAEVEPELVENEADSEEPVIETDDAPVVELVEDNAPATDAENSEAEAPQTVPVSVMIAQREARKAAEQELQLLRAQMAQMQQAKVAQADPYDDPEGYQRQQYEQIQATIRAEMAQARLMESVDRGREKYGQEALDELGDWVDQQIALDPSFEGRAKLQSDPVEWAVAERNRRNRLQEFETDEAAYVARRAKELGLVGAPVAPAFQPVTETAKKDTGPKSLVHAQPRGSTSQGTQTDPLFD